MPAGPALGDALARMVAREMIAVSSLRVPALRLVVVSSGRFPAAASSGARGERGAPGRQSGSGPARGRPSPPVAAVPEPVPGHDDTGQVVQRSFIEARGRRWERLLIRTHVIQPGEDLVALVTRYAGPFVRRGDRVFIGQKAVSIAQGRLVRERLVHPRPLAVLLSRHVKRTPFGRGLGRPATMEVALREAGVARILLAATVHLLGRPFGRSGDFYRVAGRRVASIDGVTDWALPPFNQFIVLHPTDADGVAERIAASIGVPVAIVDLNDLGGEILGASAGAEPEELVRILADNPLGQGPFRTPLGIARPGPEAGPAGMR